MLTSETIQQVEQASVADGLKIVSSFFPEKSVFSSSLGMEDQVIADIIYRHNLPVRIFTIDTGRLFNETYELLDRNTARYAKPMQVFFPDAAAVEEFVAEKGINSFYESTENRKTCCHIRKVKPLQRALSGAAIWITGLRAEQSEGRKNVKMLEWIADQQLYKFNPLINWRFDDVLQYIRENNVPYNSLHDKGFISIGCAPCTRAVLPGEDPRAGRWWWEQSQKECGLHETLIK